MIDFQIGDQVRVVGLPSSEWHGMCGVVVNTMERRIDDDSERVQECAVQFLSIRRWFLATHLVRARLDRSVRFFRGEVLNRWSDLAADDVVSLNGRREELIALLQERYGFGLKRATAEADDFISDVETRLRLATDTSANPGRTVRDSLRTLKLSA